MSVLLSTKQVSIALAKTQTILVKDISLELNDGESMVILGQSGSGKTMTCRAVMGLLDRKRFSVTGSILFEGTELLSCTYKQREKLYGGAIAMIPQNPMTALDPSMKVGKQMEETLTWHTGLKGRERTKRVEQALQEAGLQEVERVYTSYPHTLSGGMLQRVTIAMALMVQAKLVLADEPTTALDVAHRNAVIDTFIQLRSRGTAVLIVTHDFSVAAQMGGQVLVMKQGEVVERGEVRRLLAQPKAGYTKELLAAAQLSQRQGEQR